MAVDDRKVKLIIADYQGRFKGASDDLERNELAFRAIKDFRNNAGDSADESLAAAEHYLFSRFMVSNAIVAYDQMFLMVLGYDSIKAIAQTNDTWEMAMRHNKARPTSKVSADSIRWGLNGIKDGNDDKERLTPAKQAPTWNWDAMKFGGVTDAIAEFGKKHY
jgi:hypothetical protein